MKTESEIRKAVDTLDEAARVVSRSHKGGDVLMLSRPWLKALRWVLDEDNDFVEIIREAEITLRQERAANN